MGRLLESFNALYVSVRWKRPIIKVWRSVRSREWREGRHLLPAMNRAAQRRLVALLELVEQHVADDAYLILTLYSSHHGRLFLPGHQSSLVRETNDCVRHYVSIDTKVQCGRDVGELFFIARQLARQLRGVHERMEGAWRYARKQWGGDENDASFGDWRREWEQHRSEALQEDFARFFTAFGALPDGEAKREWLVRLGYELQRHSSEYSAGELALVERELGKLGLSRSDVRAPAWFVPASELRLSYYRDTWESAGRIEDWLGRAVKAVARVDLPKRGDWMGVHVSSRVSDDSSPASEFADKVADWYELSHPNIERLLGACHLGERYFVCRYASVTLADYLRNRHFVTLVNLLKPWYVLERVASGLQYLHDRGISHGRIALDQITARDQLFSDPQLTLTRWQRPTNCRNPRPLDSSDEIAMGMELLTGLNDDSDRFRADILALGWCAAEMLTGKRPWMIRLDRQPPGEVTEDEWRLVRRLCHVDSANDTISIAEVIAECRALKERSWRSRAISDASSSGEDRDAFHREPPVDWTVPGAFKSASGVLQELQDALPSLPDGMRGQDRSAAHEVVARVIDVYSSMQAMADSVSAADVRRFTEVLGQLHREIRRSAAVSSALSMLSMSSMSSVTARTPRQMPEGPLMALHKALDDLRQHLGLPQDDDQHDWRRWWDERHCQSMLQASVDAKGSVPVDTARDPDEQLVYVMYELTKRRSRYSSTEVRGMQQLLSTAGVPRLRLAQLASIPEWFIAPYDVEYDQLPFSRGSFGTVHRGKWLGTDVVVKKLILTPGQEEEQREAFYRELGIWYHLHHDNVVKLYGACHVGEPFFVCERAERGHLEATPSSEHSGTEYLNYPWIHLRDAALGLQYLHANGIVHADLKCNNILCFSEKPVARLCDFGLSVAIAHSELDGKGVGAWRWKAPEVLLGESATTASDVYSFGMCIVETVSGVYPWGADIPDASVRFQVLKGDLPLFPETFTPAQRELVTRMCRLDPSERLTIGSVVSALEWFAYVDLAPDCEEAQASAVGSSTQVQTE